MGVALSDNMSKDFWSQVCRRRAKGPSLPGVFDNAQREREICEMFCQKYSHLYNSVSYDVEDMEAVISELNSSTEQNGICSSDHIVTTFYLEFEGLNPVNQMFMS